MRESGSRRTAGADDTHHVDSASGQHVGSHGSHSSRAQLRQQAVISQYAAELAARGVEDEDAARSPRLTCVLTPRKPADDFHDEMLAALNERALDMHLRAGPQFHADDVGLHDGATR